jgi:hypothetical protein
MFRFHVFSLLYFIDLFDTRRDAGWAKIFFVRHIQIFAGILTDFKEIWMRLAEKGPFRRRQFGYRAGLNTGLNTGLNIKAPERERLWRQAVDKP